VTWHDGGAGASIAVEAFEDGQRTAAFVSELDTVDDVHRALWSAVTSLKRQGYPELFPVELEL
jgi:hypothetical protein